MQSELRLLQPGTRGGHSQISRARNHLDGFCNLRIFFGQYLHRGNGAEGRRRQLKPYLLIDKRSIAIQYWSKRLPIRVFGYIILKRVEYRLVHRKVSRFQIVSELDGAVDLVSVQARNPSGRDITRKEEERITQAPLHTCQKLRFDRFIRGNAAAAIDRSTGICATGWSGRFALIVFVSERAAAIDVVIKTTI